MPEGKVKFFDNAKCFGFILTPDQGEVYVHAGDLIDLIKKGDVVSYDLQEEAGKISACNVRRVNKKR